MSENYPVTPERKTKPKIKARPATQADIPRLVEIDLECFSDVYGDSPPPPEEIHAMLTSRQSVVGELMVVGEVDGVVEGFMTCQATDKEPEDFTTWEEATDNGYAVATHNPEGRSFYVINLTVTPKGSETNVSDLIVANLYGQFIEQQKEKTLLLSRIPEFSIWIKENDIDFEILTPAEKDSLAETYLKATKIIDGKEVPYDGILRRMIREGSQPVRVIRDGFEDSASRNYGVLCAHEGPLPVSLRRNKLTAKLAGKALKFASQHPALLRRFL